MSIVGATRIRAAQLEAAYRGARSDQQRVNEEATRWSSFSNETRESFEAMLPGYVTTYGRSVTLQMFKTDEQPTEEYWKNNRLAMIHAIAYLKAVDVETRKDGDFWSQVYGCSTIDTARLMVTINVEGYIDGETYEAYQLEQHPAVKLLDVMYGVTIEKDDIIWARDRYTRQLGVYASQQPKVKGRGIEKLFENAPVVYESVINEQFKMLEENVTNNLVARTWGFEIEIPDAKGVPAPAGVEKGDDGSLRSYEAGDDCDCDCDDCNYHDCDCDNCYNRNTDPDHCGNSECATCDSAEYRTIGGIQRMQHAGMFKLCQDLADKGAELNDSAGTHIHVYAQDLTTNQVGQVMATYRWLDTIIRPIAGRKNVNYAMEIPVSYIASALSRKNATITKDKPREINCMHLFNGRGTIEFRQMDCNANAKRITAWAWLVRGLVTAAKRGATLSNYKECKDLNDVIGVLARFNVYTDNEHPEQVVYGSKNDAEIVAPMLVQHKSTN
jgi:hypothetical protein